jgi:hypothetical protein
VNTEPQKIAFIPEGEPLHKIRGYLSWLVMLFGGLISGLGAYLQSLFVYVLGWPFVFIGLIAFVTTGLQYTFSGESGFRKLKWRDRPYRYW